MSTDGPSRPGIVSSVTPPPTNTPAAARAGRAATGSARAGGRSTPRRATHSLEQILSTAIAILDRDGTRGFTLRGLAAELGGGLGSVYWYVDGKHEVLTLACDALVGEALARAGGADPSDGRAGGPALETSDPVVAAAITELRRTCIALFDQTQLHPWLAPQLQVQAAGAPNALRFWERLGRPLAAMDLTPRQQFHGSTAMSGYVIGVAAEMAAQDLHADPERSQHEQLDDIVDGWLAQDPEEFSWIHSIADEFRGHDDSDQFTAGLDLLLGGLVRQAVERAGSAPD
jgi:AcrR family transcriptional regulator